MRLTATSDSPSQTVCTKLDKSEGRQYRVDIYEHVGLCTLAQRILVHLELVTTRRVVLVVLVSSPFVFLGMIRVVIDVMATLFCFLAH